MSVNLSLFEGLNAVHQQYRLEIDFSHDPLSLYSYYFVSKVTKYSFEKDFYFNFFISNLAYIKD